MFDAGFLQLRDVFRLQSSRRHGARGWCESSSSIDQPVQQHAADHGWYEPQCFK